MKANALFLLLYMPLLSSPSVSPALAESLAKVGNNIGIEMRSLKDAPLPFLCVCKLIGITHWGLTEWSFKC